MFTLTTRSSSTTHENCPNDVTVSGGPWSYLQVKVQTHTFGVIYTYPKHNLNSRHMCTVDFVQGNGLLVSINLPSAFVEATSSPSVKATAAASSKTTASSTTASSTTAASTERHNLTYLDWFYISTIKFKVIAYRVKILFYTLLSNSLYTHSHLFYLLFCVKNIKINVCILWDTFTGRRTRNRTCHVRLKWFCIHTRLV